MRIAFLHTTFRTEHGGTTRARTVLSRLRLHHEVDAFDVVGVDDEIAEGEADVEALRVLKRQGVIAQRFAVGYQPRLNAEAIQTLRDACEPHDWIWISSWPVLACGDLVKAWIREGKAVTADEDCLARQAFSAARHYMLRRPWRALARGASGLSLLIYERRYLSNVSAVVARCEPDANWLRRTQSAAVFVMPNAIDYGAFEAVRRTKPSSVRPDVMFIGTSYEPNLEGMRWFVRRVWPRIRRAEPSATLRLVGRGLSANTVGSLPGVQVVGEVRDIRSELATARVVVAPVRYGSGSPNKVIEGAAAGRPLVVTPFLASAVSCPALVIASRRRSWVDAVLRQLGDSAHADRVGTLTAACAERAMSLPGMDARLAELAAALSPRQ